MCSRLRVGLGLLGASCELALLVRSPAQQELLEQLRGACCPSRALAAAGKRGVALDKEIVLAAVQKDPECLEDLDDVWRADREVVLDSVRASGLALQFASEALRRDHSVVAQALEQDGDALQYASDELRSQRPLVLQAVRSKPSSLQHASDQLKDDRGFLLELLPLDGTLLKFAPKHLQQDKEVALAAVRRAGEALHFASAELRGDRELALEALAQNVDAWIYVEAPAREDKAVLLEALSGDGNLLAEISEPLRGCKELVLAAVTSRGTALQFASARLRADREVVLAAVSSHCDALQDAAPELKVSSDKEIMMAAVAQDGNMLMFAAEPLRNDRQLVTAALLCSGAKVLCHASEELRFGCVAPLALESITQPFRDSWGLPIPRTDLFGSYPLARGSLYSDNWLLAIYLWLEQLALQAVEELIQLHLCSDHAAEGWSSPLVANLPITRLGDLRQEDIARYVPIRKDLVSTLSHESTATKIYQWIMAYQESKSYLSYTRVNARILACELLKEWAYAHRHLQDRDVEMQAVCRYKEFAAHLLYFHEKWAESEHGATRSKYLGQPHGILRSKHKETFVSLLVKVQEALAKLQVHLEKAENSESHCSVFLGQVVELFQNLLDQAAGICFLGPTEHSQDLTEGHEDFSLEVLAKQRLAIQGHQSEVFWSTDWGRVLDAALRQGDPEKFQALGSWLIFYQEKGTACKMCRYYSQSAAEQRLRQMPRAAILLGPGPEYRRTLNRKDLEHQVEPLIEAIDAHLLVIGAKEPELNQVPEVAETDGDLWDFLQSETPAPLASRISHTLEHLPEEDAGQGYARARALSMGDCSTNGSTRRRGQSESSIDTEAVEELGSLGQEVELVRAKWTAQNWSRSGLAADGASPEALPQVVLQMAEDLATLLEIRRTILGPLEGVCVQLGTLRSRRVLHTALARLTLHVDHFVECAMQFHQLFEAKLFDSLRSTEKPAFLSVQKPPVQRSYRRCFQRALALRKEIVKKVQKLAEAMPLQSTEDEQCSFEQLKTSMTALAQALWTGPPNPALADGRLLALGDQRRFVAKVGPIGAPKLCFWAAEL
ncbi:unnamed protein product [Effrenium voratum]|uniref:DUF4116 domain-containing protein n=1 Tax=Effrenium voratum TaxID=2562239 RepID=A0AA36J3G2_9DINO|nr:unnamed protein product [Effrenium voratum]